MPDRAIKAVLHWAIPLLGLLVLGPLLARPAVHLLSPTGSAHVSLLTSDQTPLAIGIFLAAVACALGLGAFSGKLFGPRPAMTTAGLMIIWPVWMLGESGRVLAQGVSPITYAIEGVFAMLAILLFAVVFARVGKGGQGSDALGDPLRHLKAIARPAGLASLAVGIVALLAIVWLLARGDERGQAIFSTGVAAFGAGILGRLAAEQLDQDSPLVGVVVGVALAPIFAPIVGMVLTSDVADAAASGTLSGLLRVQPLDWIPGVALGLMPGFAAAARQAEDVPVSTRPQSGSKPQTA